VEVTGAPFPRRRLAGDTLLRVPGDNSRRDQAQETQHDTGNPAGHTRGWTWARLGRIDGEGGLGWRTSPAIGVPGARKGPGLRHLVHKLRGESVVLTRGLWWPVLQRRMAGDEVLRRRRSGSRGGG
jgi:hypothetical protein